MAENMGRPMSKDILTWTPDEHIVEASRLLNKTAHLSRSRSTGNAPIGMILAGVHAQMAQAKLLQMVIAHDRPAD